MVRDYLYGFIFLTSSFLNRIDLTAAECNTNVKMLFDDKVKLMLYRNRMTKIGKADVVEPKN